MSPRSSRIRIVCISDTHNAGPGEGYTLPKGDILIHAGDLTNQGNLPEIRKAIDWLERADFAHKIIVAGNHDLSLDPGYALKRPEGWKVQPNDIDECKRLVSSASTITYLQHKSTDVKLPGTDITLKVFGSPYSPERGHQNWAFQYLEGQPRSLWEEIPPETDILITHAPPAGHCDASEHWRDGGCSLLRAVLWHVRPMLHVCGHCHEGRGAEVVRWSDVPNEIEQVREWGDPGKGNKKQSLFDLTGIRGSIALEAGKETAIVNASIMARSFGRGAKVFNKPIVVDIDVSGRAASKQRTEDVASSGRHGAGSE